jgi:glutamate dehydrogenase/leucine dehydrogenase
MQLAGLWHGGGKGVIPRSPGDMRPVQDRVFRAAMFEDYGEFLTSLNGAYVCAEDVGLNVEVCVAGTENTNCKW